MTPHSSKLAALLLSTAIIAVPAGNTATACTRTLFVGLDNLVLTGRNMDWEEDMSSNLWAFPEGMERDGAAGPKSIHWHRHPRETEQPRWAAF